MAESSGMPEKFTFANPAWVDAARAVLEDLVARHGVEGHAFSLTEVFTGAPAAASPTGVAAWHFVIKGKTVKVGTGEHEGSDGRLEVDYHQALPVARLIYTPEILAKRAKARAEGQPNPIKGDMSKAPSWLVELHNEMAVRTA
jgi:hypothetical protein